jgi:hypothetical protein
MSEKIIVKFQVGLKKYDMKKNGNYIIIVINI